MAIEKVVNIVVKEQGLDAINKKVVKLDHSIDDLKGSQSSLTKTMGDSSNAILENGGAMGLLNDATGGMAMTVKDAVEATWLFTKGTALSTTAQKVYTLVVGTTTGALKALRIALVATGLGALVVALGFVISKIMEMESATEKMERAQRKLNSAFEASNQIYKDQIELIDTVTKSNTLRAKIAGKSEKELREIEKQGTEEKFKALKEEQTRLLALQAQKGKSVEDQKKINDALLKNSAEFNKLIADEQNKGLEYDLGIADKKREKQKENNAKSREQEKEDRLKALKEKEEFDKSVAEGLTSFQIASNEAEFAQRALDIENRKNQADEIAGIAKKEADDEIAEAERVRVQKEIIEKQKIAIINNSLGILAGIAKKGSAVSKALAITEIVRNQVKSASQALSNLAIANTAAAAASPLTAGQPFVGLNTAQAVTGIALSAVGAGKAIKDIMSESKSVSGGGSIGGGGSGGGSAPSAPSFNLVQGTGTNQIAQGLAGENRPIRAYVTSSDVTSRQALDRNIIENASL